MTSDVVRRVREHELAETLAPMQRLQLADALRLAEVARAAAEADGRAVGVVVVDATGNAVLEQRMDGAYLSVLKIARGKAFTALNFGRPTAEMAERLGDASYQALLSLADGRLTFLRGGIPLRIHDVIVGAIGISGASAHEDETYAQRAAEALGGV